MTDAIASSRIDPGWQVVLGRGARAGGARRAGAAAAGSGWTGAARPRRRAPHACPAPRRSATAERQGGAGELDEYYVFFSSGQSGEVRIIGLPSMRELMRIPVFNRCSATGWGQTNESLKILTEGLPPETQEFLKTRGGTYQNGDLHHPHMSFTDGTYDGRYLFCNDKANTPRRAHPLRRHEVRQDHRASEPAHGATACACRSIRRTGYVFCNGEDGVPIPNDGKILDDPKKYQSHVHGRRRRHDEGRLAGHGRRQSRQRRCRLPGQVRLLDLLQLRGGRDARRDDRQRAGLGRRLQPQAHRGGGAKKATSRR